RRQAAMCVLLLMPVGSTTRTPVSASARPANRNHPAQTGAQLPIGVSAVWDLNTDFHETTPTRERICLNGLWRWQPADDASSAVPSGRWGYFKVPGCWPGITDYMQKDCQTVFAHPDWQSVNPGEIKSAWYQRELTIP